MYPLLRQYDNLNVFGETDPTKSLHKMCHSHSGHFLFLILCHLFQALRWMLAHPGHHVHWS